MQKSTSDKLDQQSSGQPIPQTSQPANTPSATITLPPGTNDHCLQCNYPLKNLQTWRCPECGHLTTETERALNQEYLKTANRFIILCIAVPTGILAGSNILIFMIYTALHETPLNVDGLLILIPILAVLYITIQPWTLIFAAGRLTQIQVIKRFAPAALSAKPGKAITLFLLHLIWMSLIPIVTIILVFGAILNSIF